MRLLDVKDLKVRFGDGRAAINAVDSVSFAVESNEIVGLVGESGSGKTITGYSVMGILPREAKVESGSINFEGKNILSLTR